MTIHSTHPFEPEGEERDPIRRFRGRVGGAVSLWTAGEGIDRVGLTVTSFLVAGGEPARVVVLLHPDSDLLDRLGETSVGVVSLLEWRDRDLAEVFAGQFPAPGGPFKQGEWTQTEWGPRLVSAPTWVGVRLDESSRRDVGWSVLVEAVVEHAELGEEVKPLLHRRGRYLHL